MISHEKIIASKLSALALKAEYQPVLGLLNATCCYCTFAYFAHVHLCMLFFLRVFFSSAAYFDYALSFTIPLYVDAYLAKIPFALRRLFIPLLLQYCMIRIRPRICFHSAQYLFLFSVYGIPASNLYTTLFVQVTCVKVYSGVAKDARCLALRHRRL